MSSPENFNVDFGVNFDDSDLLGALDALKTQTVTEPADPDHVPQLSSDIISDQEFLDSLRAMNPSATIPQDRHSLPTTRTGIDKFFEVDTTSTGVQLPATSVAAPSVSRASQTSVGGIASNSQAPAVGNGFVPQPRSQVANVAFNIQTPNPAAESHFISPESMTDSSTANPYSGIDGVIYQGATEHVVPTHQFPGDVGSNIQTSNPATASQLISSESTTGFGTTIAYPRLNAMVFAQRATQPGAPEFQPQGNANFSFDPFINNSEPLGSLYEDPSAATQLTGGPYYQFQQFEYDDYNGNTNDYHTQAAQPATQMEEAIAGSELPQYNHGLNYGEVAQHSIATSTDSKGAHMHELWNRYQYAFQAFRTAGENYKYFDQNQWREFHQTTTGVQPDYDPFSFNLDEPLTAGLATPPSGRTGFPTHVANQFTPRRSDRLTRQTHPVSSSSDSPSRVEKQVKPSRRRGQNATNKCKTEKYNKSPKELGSWGRKRDYNEFGELRPGQQYTADELRTVLYENPRLDNLQIWVQRAPAQSAERYGSEAAAICRLENCPIKGNKITAGHLRLGFDELTKNNNQQDPYQNAGYVHLFCAEKFMDLPQMIQDFDFRIDDRVFRTPDVNKMNILPPMDALIRKFVREVEAGNLSTKYPDYPTLNDRHVKPWAYEHTLSMIYWKEKLETEPTTRQTTRDKRGNTDTMCNKHKGDLDMLAVAIQQKEAARRR